jgi:hypothetical protein
MPEEKRTSGPKGQMFGAFYVRAEARTYQAENQLLLSNHPSGPKGQMFGAFYIRAESPYLPSREPAFYRLTISALSWRNCE